MTSNDLNSGLSLGASEAGGGAVGGEGATQEVPEAGRGEGGGQAEDQGQGLYCTVLYCTVLYCTLVYCL